MKQLEGDMTMTGIDTTSPPVAGPFIVTWEGLDADAPPGTPWTMYVQRVPTEAQAVRLWQDCHLYENMRPVAISPEPRWNRYPYDGHTPLTR